MSGLEFFFPNFNLKLLVCHLFLQEYPAGFFGKKSSPDFSNWKPFPRGGLAFLVLWKFSLEFAKAKQFVERMEVW